MWRGCATSISWIITSQAGPSMSKLLVLVIALTMSATAAAQWLNYPTRGVPRGPDGKPNLAAPAPRTADGKPDFSGIWQIEPDGGCPALGCQVDYPVAMEFRNLGAKLPGGSLPYRPWAAALVKERTAQLG